MRAVSGAQSALKELSKLLPDTAEVMRNGKVEIVSLSELKKAIWYWLSRAEEFPRTEQFKREYLMLMNLSPPANQSRFQKEGDEVIAGTTNGDGSLKILVTKIGEETFLAGVMRLVAEAQSSKSRLQKGEFGVDSIVSMSEVSEAEVLQIVASVNRESEHPIARAIVNEAKRKV